MTSTRHTLVQIKKARQGSHDRRNEVKQVLGAALKKARGLTTKNDIDFFKKGDALVDAARYTAQRQPNLAIEVLEQEVPAAEMTIKYAEESLAAARGRAATLYLELGQVAAEQKLYEKAIGAFKNMLRVNPGDIDALRQLGLVHRAMKQYDLAIPYFEGMLTTEAHESTQAEVTAEAYLEIGRTQRLARRFADATAALEQAIKLDVENNNQRRLADAHLDLGLTKRDRTFWKQAAESFDAATKIYVALGDQDAAATTRREQAENENLRLAANGKKVTINGSIELTTQLQAPTSQTLQ